MRWSCQRRVSVVGDGKTNTITKKKLFCIFCILRSTCDSSPDRWFQASLQPESLGATPALFCQLAGVDCVNIWVIVVDCVVSDRWPPPLLSSSCLFTVRLDTLLCLWMCKTKPKPAIIIRRQSSVWVELGRSVGEWFIKTQCVLVCVGVCRRASVFCVNDSIFSVCARAGGGRPSQYSPCLERRLLIPLLPGKWGYKYLQHMEALMTWHTQAHTETPKQTWMHGRVCQCAQEWVLARLHVNKPRKTGLRDAISASVMNQEVNCTTFSTQTALFLKVLDVCDAFLC